MATIAVQKNTNFNAVQLEANIEQAREFSTGSVGWYVNGKADIDGAKYQVAAQAVVIGSKGLGGVTPEFLKALGAAKLVALAGGKSFKTGSTGYYATWKQDINGQSCQCSATLTMIGSSPASQAKAGERAAAAQQRADEIKRKAEETMAALKALKASIGQ